ncbi:hypothetical protein CAEBREN_20715 [Caenorhabditis brenneri]|uniref:Uncharacterized protein n=1 Tax=Caenorhabditis brenneri TaxID=135651 RepID=G0NVP1_CAEBE|nr:hypothetical protein CAEBREN_20715 [Caenorhabditis brenneri]
MRLSFLSKRCKRMIKQVLPSKAQYDCRVWPKQVSIIDISSQFGSYTSFEPTLDHIIELLSYPPIQVAIDGKDNVNYALEWVKAHQHCVKDILYMTYYRSIPHEHILEFVNSFIEFNVRIELENDMVVDCSQEELLIHNPTITLTEYFWRLKCRKIRIVDASPPCIAEMFLGYFTFDDIGESSLVEQMVFELKEYNQINWTRLRNGKKVEEELQHPM